MMSQKLPDELPDGARRPPPPPAPPRAMTVTTWMGKPIDELPREKLLEVIEYLGQQNQRLTAERIGMWAHVDVRSYLMARPGAAS